MFHSPLNYPALVPKDRRLIIAGLGDRLAPPQQAEALWEHWDRCAFHWFPGNHILHVSQPDYLRRMTRFMRDFMFRLAGSTAARSPGRTRRLRSSAVGAHRRDRARGSDRPLHRRDRPGTARSRLSDRAGHGHSLPDVPPCRMISSAVHDLHRTPATHSGCSVSVQCVVDPNAVGREIARVASCTPRQVSLPEGSDGTSAGVDEGHTCKPDSRRWSRQPTDRDLGGLDAAE